MSNMILKNCKTIDNQTKNIIIENGKIESIKKTLLASDMTSDEVIDIKDNIVIPGMIDPHVHFRDPGLTYKEDWKSGSQAAAHGGYTTVIDMPNTKPQTDTLKNFIEKKRIALKKSVVDFGLQAGVKSDKDVQEILEEKPASYKIFMDLYDDNQLREMFRSVARTNKPLCLHCEDKTIIKNNMEHLKKNESTYTNTKAYSYARSGLAEIISVKKAIEYTLENKQHIHLCHVSTRQSLELVDAYKNKAKISLEVTPHHLFLTNAVYDSYGVKAKTNPPLRNVDYNVDDDYLDEFDCVATDHAPHTLEEKQKDTWSSAAGIPGLEVTMKLLLTLVNKRKLSLKQLISLTSKRATEIFDIKNKGKIAEGYDADLTVLDLKQEGTISVDKFYTNAKYTPFEGCKYVGSNIMTINRGTLIAEYDEVYENECRYIY
ncbi:MAG: hypothetical protein BZ136_03080 [Methanosphaera sp. rholeuAM74]|nr:MAG: hypothetical protein BZ136_03080 [Methanosphaera sp. rholeuAM74]